MFTRRLKRGPIWVTVAALMVGGVAGVASIAHAASPILPGNEGDVGKYTNGQKHAMEIGDPVYNNVGNVAAQLVPGVPFTASSMHQSIFEKDLAAGGTDYYLDRILGVSGTIGSPFLMTRGRSLYMRGSNTANFTTMGFAGTTYVGGPNNLGNLYTVTVTGQTVTEVSANRFNAPSHAKDQYTIGSTGVTANLTKFITYDNVAVTAIDFNNPGSSAATFTVRAASPLATAAGESDAELTGSRVITSGSNNGLVDTPWNTVKVDLTGAGFTRNGTNLDRTITVPAGGKVSLSVVGAVSSATLPQTVASYKDYAAMAPSDAVRSGITEFNRRWAQDIPYINVPDPALEKAIVYRWWGERYNSLDANTPGYVYQYPTTVEGANLYQNSIALTQPMHLQDTKWIRTPYLPYGEILNIGELSGSSAFLDSPGHTSWNNHYSQYVGTAGLEAYQVHGGGQEIAQKFAQYFEGDGVGQLEHYDGNKNNLIAYDTNYMAGNDADAISFGFPKSNATAAGSRTIERPESAYVWGDFDAARQLYQIAGADPSKVNQMATGADNIRDSILSNLWSPDMRMFLTRTSYGATSGASSNGTANPLPVAARNLIPAKESNLYDIYAEDLIPYDQWQQYVDGFRFLTYDDNFPIFPFYTANQYDRTAYGIGGSNNFSNINFTVQYRGVRSALRHYDPQQKYITPEYAKRLLDWMAWSVYPGADMRIPNQAEYFSGWNASTKTYNRNNPNHVMLGNMNYIFVEDMAGLQPRSDDKIELWPIKFGYDYFMANNLRYHGHDLTVVWDPTGSKYGLGAGYSLFVDGQKKVSTDKLGKITYDPNTNQVQAESGVNVTFQAGTSTAFPSAVNTPITDGRVVDYLKTAGIDLTVNAPNLAKGATLRSSYTQQGPRPAAWRQFHTPGYSSTSMNYTPGAISETERPVSLAAVTDGNTANEPYWGNYGTTEKNGYIELDLGSAKSFDNVKVTFVSDRQAGGYHEPSRWWIQVPDGNGGWKEVPNQFKNPTVPAAKFNEALFNTVSASKVRVVFTNSPTYYTAISEIQIFNSGRAVPAVTNQAPVVSVARDASADGNLSTKLVATASDDGIPYDSDLTFGWETVSAPQGAGVIFSDPKALTTRVTGTLPGDYVFRFFAFDGEKRSVATIPVTLTKKAVSAEFGSSATVSTSGSASWENPLRVNESTNPSSSNPGTGYGWGNWGTTQNGTTLAKAAWIQYTWSSAVRLSSTDIYWYDDNGGTRRPTATTYALESSQDGTTWTPVTLNKGSSYANGLNINAYNHFDFEPITARFLRIRIWGVQGSGAGTGVLRWRANGETVDSVRSPVYMRTGIGMVPTLPSTLDAVYASGARGTVGIRWQEITPDMVAEANVDPFVVYGMNDAYGLIVEADIYVRPEMSQGGISIQGAESFEQTLEVGQQPYLPKKVDVSYNDGSRDNQAIAVNWNYDANIVNTPGRYVVIGDLALPDYVSQAGATQTALILTVGKDTVAPTTTMTWSPAEPDGGDNWYRTAPSFKLDAKDAFGVASTQYRLDGGEWTAYTGTPVTLNEQGTHKVEYRSTDTSGNVEESKSSTVKVDTIAPTVNASISVANASDRLVTVVATDAGSGVASVTVKVDDADWADYTSPVKIDKSQHTVVYRAVDVAGNQSETTLHVASAPAITSQSSVTLTNQMSVTVGDVQVRGDFTCNSQVRVAGNVLVTGNAYLTNTCRIDGDLRAGGNVTIDSTPSVGGSVFAVGSVRFQSTAKVGGSISAGTTFTVIDGKTIDYLTSHGIVGGTVKAGVGVSALTVAGFTPAEFDGNAAGRITWRQWMNATAAANGAPSSSQGLTANPGCTMAPWASSVNAGKVTVASDLVVDARTATSGCASVALQEMTVKLRGNLVIYVDKFDAVNGIAFVSDDGGRHSVKVIVTGSNSQNGAVTFSANSTTDALVDLTVHTPGKVTIQGTSALAAVVESGSFASSGSVVVR
ncbi:OmpL47-type beta-barrel domain-containing protein [Dactylosporangium sp. NPDC048998]|uniref:OmpL47-type beta-barrel domain-containing protein n=1 Tax=Dactylosporangium sp. NPDC048998 TaxID=3363976 RepID=UPI0037137D8D